MLLDGEHVIGLYFAPAVDADHIRPQLRAGMTVVGRVSAISPGLNGAFIDLGKAHRAGFLPVRKSEKPPHEGALGAFIVKRAAVKGKGTVLGQSELVPAKAARLTPGRILTGADPIEIMAHDLVIRPENVYCTRSDQNEKIRKAIGRDPSNNIDTSIYQVFQETLDRSLSHKISLKGGGYAIFDECEGATVIDIDSGDVDAATRRISRKINDNAVHEIFKQMRCRSIAGRVVVDFLPPRSREERDHIEDGIGKQKHLLPTACFGSLQKDGLFDLTIPKYRESLLDLATKKTSENGLPPSRSYTTEWIARALIFEIERRLANAPGTFKFDVSVGNVLRDYLQDITQDLENIVVAKSSGRVTFSTSENLKETSYAIYEQ